ncbi:MAG TPA: prolyl oligopeptidase family serine peptidase, partial [Gemmatimonadaceae bacterium]
VLSGMVVTPEITWVYDIGVADLRTGATRIIARRVPNLWGPTISWSPDGLHIAFTTKPHSYGLQDLPDRPLPPGDCYVASVLSDSVRDLTPGAHVDLGASFHAPVWGADGSTLFLVGGGDLWRADAQRGGFERIGRVPGRAAVAILTSGPFARPWPSNAGNTLLLRTLDERTLKVGVARIDVRTGASELAYEDDEWLPGASRTAFGMSAAADVFVYQRESAAHPGDLWVADPTFLARRRLTHINPQLDDYVFGERRLIYWRSDDGDSLRGALLLPAGYKAGKRYPLISYQYGGENWSMFANNFGVIPMVGDYVQILATRGYAVLVPDAPQHIGTPMLDLAKTVLPGVNRAIELGVADPARLGIMGLSYGCFSTLMIVVQTTRFKAAECSSGASSIIGMAGTELGWAWADSGQGKMGATVWQRRDRYIENSAYFYLDRVTTPILMVNGTADRGVPSFLADATYEALRQLGKRVEYVRYVGEGHGPMYYSRANVTDYLNRLVRWFGTYFADSSGSSEPGTLR